MAELPLVSCDFVANAIHVIGVDAVLIDVSGDEIVTCMHRSRPFRPHGATTGVWPAFVGASKAVPKEGAKRNQE